MKRSAFFALAALNVICLIALCGNAQQPAATSDAAASTEKLPPGAERTKDGKIIYRGRLPRNFNKIGLFFKQKQDVYRIQAQYRVKIEAKQKEIDDLEQQRDAEIMKLLRDDQKKYLKELEAEDEKDTESGNAPAETE